MDMDAYQAFTRTTASYRQPTTGVRDGGSGRRNNLEYVHMGITSEVGELCDLRKLEIRDGLTISRQERMKELGDILWYLARLAAEYDILLSEVANANMAKLMERQARGTINKTEVGPREEETNG